MLELCRTVRFCLSPDPGDDHSPRDNTFASWPAMRGLGRYYEVQVICHGLADPQTGYFINIKQIDTAVREHVLPQLRQAIADEQAAMDVGMGQLMRDLFTAIAPALNHTVHHFALQLTPTLALVIEKHAMNTILIKQQYEFSAAHRLHVSEFDDEQNRQTFGKCNNPAGHGHNYRVEVVVGAPIDAQGQTISPAALDAMVDQHVIEKLDHKHLNVDVPEFAEQNPSVENIVQVVWDYLTPGLTDLPDGTHLDEVSVWETGKTVCTYRGPGA
ncbi:MAG: 6-carboxytetrahydropterin synthase [Planctomycetota bacterium]